MRHQSSGNVKSSRAHLWRRKMDMADLRFAFAGDRDISVWVLDHLLELGHRPVALCVSDSRRASHADTLRARCGFLREDRVLQGRRFATPDGIQLLRRLDLDFIVGIHFPYIVPAEVLSVPRHGVLNLHPSYLPFNRGWHTPSWVLLDGTPAGATLHFMASEVDAGDIVHQKSLDVSPADTAHTLYERLKRLELEVFVEAWPQVVAGTFVRTIQDAALATIHNRADLSGEDVQRIDLERPVPAGDLLRRLRALTTNRIEEAAYFEQNGRRYRVQVRIEEEVPQRDTLPRAEQVGPVATQQPATAAAHPGPAASSNGNRAGNSMPTPPPAVLLP